MKMEYSEAFQRAEVSWILNAVQGGTMRCHLAMLFVGLLTGIPAWAQTAPGKEQTAIVTIAQKAAIRALAIKQGDALSLTQSRELFTPEGWSAFMQVMKEWLDQKGAPTFGSSFVPSGDAVIIGEADGVIHFKIPGTVTQTHDKSRTVYKHAELDVRAGGEPVKMLHLEQIYVGR